jgi:uncharacterized protein (UPF0261 family)
MLDTKGDEIRYLASEIKAFGGKPLLLDLSLGKEADWADIKVGEVLAAQGKNKDEMFAMSRSAAVDYIGPCVEKKIIELYRQGLVNGIISWAGSMGTSAVTYAMRALPLGVPKVMLCTSASRDVSKWVGVKDIFMTNPISEKGINRITRKTARNAVAAVVAMGKLELEPSPEKEEKPLAAVTLYGTTTPVAVQCAQFLENRGFDVLYFHQTGIGALMEELIREGEICVVFEITPGEISKNDYYPAASLALCDRLTAAFDMGIPSITTPGGLDQIPINRPFDSIPEHFKRGHTDRMRVSYRNLGKPYIHNIATTIVSPTLEENKEMSFEIVRKFNTAKGPAVFILPMKGWSAYDQSAEHAALSPRMGWVEDCDGPVWIPDRQNPQWSLRAVEMWKIMKSEWNRNKTNTDLLRVNMHILDESFAELCCRIMGDILDGQWKQGLYAEVPGVLFD